MKNYEMMFPKRTLAALTFWLLLLNISVQNYKIIEVYLDNRHPYMQVSLTAIYLNNQPTLIEPLLNMILVGPNGTNIKYNFSRHFSPL